jgi:type II secretory pathway predicted ATPase ExeA
MYEQFFGFRERPFDLTPNPRYLVLTEAHQEALNNLEYGIASRKGITLLVGEAGSGKTTVIRAAIEKQSVRVHAVHLHNPTLSRAEFSEMLSARFALSPDAARSKTAMLLELERLLTDRSAAGETTVLIVDEAQSLPLDLLEEIRLLANIETNDQKLLSVIIAGQPELVGRLNEPALRQFKQRVSLRCELRSLTLDETARYLDGRVKSAGGAGADVFTRDSVALIHQHAHGLPRLISVIADNALLGAFAAGQQPVTAEVVRDVCKDFDLSAMPTAAPQGDVRWRETPARFLREDGPEVRGLGLTGLPGPKLATTVAHHGAAKTAAEPDVRPTPAPVEPVRQQVAESTAASAADAAVQDHAGMFSSFSGKRKRLSLFGK